MSRTHDVSIDLETASCGQDAAILSIGAARFDMQTGLILAKFYMNIDLDSSTSHYARTDPDTLQWWAEQSEEARAALEVAKKSLPHALHRFAGWVPKKVRLWGNGSNFDNRILRESYDLCGIQCPWHWRDDADLRTLKVAAALSGYFPPCVPSVGTHHNALDDATHQAKLIVALMDQIKGGSLHP